MMLNMLALAREIEQTEEWKRLNATLSKKLEKSLQMLGTKWILHPRNPKNKVIKKGVTHATNILNSSNSKPSKNSKNKS